MRSPSVQEMCRRKDLEIDVTRCLNFKLTNIRRNLDREETRNKVTISFSTVSNEYGLQVTQFPISF